jgi:hypothetical protein
MDETTWRQAITDQIIKLDSPLKQTTVVAYIEQRIMGLPFDTSAFWKRPDTCSRAAWNKWKRYDSVFNEVLTATWEIAVKYRSQEAANAITEAVLTLQLNAPGFAQKVVELAIGDGPIKDDIRLRAALAGLDRASEMTAQKAEVHVPGLDEALDKIWGNEAGSDAVADDDTDA